MKFRKILCSVDFSETSFKALQWAEYLAKRFDSLLTVLHSIETPFANDASNTKAGYKNSKSYRIICDSKIPVITVIIPDCLKQSIAAHSNLERLYKNGGDV
jgi:hypothetical protein